MKMRFEGWKPVGGLDFAASAQANAKNSDPLRRFPPGEREGAVQFWWETGGCIVMHGGRVAAPAKRHVVHGSLLVFNPADAPNGWVEAFERKDDGVNAPMLVRGPARWRHAGVLYDESGTLVVHGGKDEDGNVRSDVHLFNLVRQTWESFGRWAGGCEPPQMFGHGMVALPMGAIVAIGPEARQRAKRVRGTDPASSIAAKEVMAIYTLDLAGIDKTWRRAEMPTDEACPAVRRDFALAAAGDGQCLYLAGGGYATSTFADAWKFDLQLNRWSPIGLDFVGRTLAICPTTLSDGCAADLVLAVSGKGVSYTTSRRSEAAAASRQRHRGEGQRRAVADPSGNLPAHAPESLLLAVMRVIPQPANAAGSSKCEEEGETAPADGVESASEPRTGLPAQFFATNRRGAVFAGVVMAVESAHIEGIAVATTPPVAAEAPPHIIAAESVLW